MDADGLLDVLGNEHARELLVATADRPCSVDELTELTDASQPTVYRQVEALQELGLLHERRGYADGTHYRTYEAELATIAVELTPEGFDAVVDAVEPEAVEDDSSDGLDHDSPTTRSP
ncbi:hypothetical protein JCM17823_27530 [Halorubrum gandharaense]